MPKPPLKMGHLAPAEKPTFWTTARRGRNDRDVPSLSICWRARRTPNELVQRPCVRPHAGAERRSPTGDRQPVSERSLYQMHTVPRTELVNASHKAGANSSNPVSRESGWHPRTVGGQFSGCLTSEWRTMHPEPPAPHPRVDLTFTGQVDSAKARSPVGSTADRVWVRPWGQGMCAGRPETGSRLGDRANAFIAPPHRQSAFRAMTSGVGRVYTYCRLRRQSGNP
jgi:hypothetical protein